MIIVFLFLTPKLKSERLELWVQATLRFYFILYSFLFFLSQDISPTFNYTCRHEFIACYSQGSRPKLSRWGLFCTNQRAYLRKKHPAQRIRTNQSEIVNTAYRSFQLLYAVILIFVYILVCDLWKLKLWFYLVIKYKVLARYLIQSLARWS